MVVKQRKLFYFKKIYILSFFKNQKGIAVLEMLPLLVIFIMLFGLTFAFWSAIHSGTLNSIGARHYAFEVLNNRSDITYHRNDKGADVTEDNYYDKGYRYFAVVDWQKAQDPEFFAVEKELNLFGGKEFSSQKFEKHLEKANPIWIQSAYGICLNWNCGDGN